MRIMGIDLSTRVGLCVMDDGKPIKFMTYVLPKAMPEDYAARTLPLRRWLRLMIEQYKPDAFGLESPFVPFNMAGDEREEGKRFSTTVQTLRLQISLAAEAETTAKECGVPIIREAATASCKVALTGTARLGKEKKRAMVSAAIARGWAVADDHQADAAAVCLVVLEEFGVAA